MTKNLKNGLSNLDISYSNGVITKKIKYNNEYIVPLTKLLNEKHWFIPNYFQIDNELIKYEYIVGKTLRKTKRISKKNLIILSKIIKKIYNSFLNNDTFYGHGDISPVNLVFNKKNQLISVIDWDSLHETSFKYEDLFYSMWTCINIGNHWFSNKKIKLIFLFLKHFDYQINGNIENEIVMNFNIIFDLTLKKAITQNYKNLDVIINWINDSKKFINKYQNKINKLERRIYHNQN